MGVSAGVALRQRRQQCLGLLQVGGVKALGEPAVERRQQVVGLGALALVLPESAQAHRGAEFEGLGLLLTSHGEGLPKTPLAVVLLPTALGWVALGCAP
jgi:hypothetical protein